ncbi:MAG TPA: glutathione S-transferase family protein [Alphaproteobacteria bacterium]|nr:glutathione S-transferase family protein [Alphaproteobacteria bacterium]
MKLYDNGFSPFARKVRMVLDFKGLDYETVDGLVPAGHAELVAANGRAEVPVLVDGDIKVVNSADIVAYLDRQYPEPPVYPADPKMHVRARAWERCADSTIDPILIDISYWLWAKRPDVMPVGLLDAAREDMNEVFAALERDLEGNDYVCGTLGIADLALLPHISACRAVDVPIDADRFSRVTAWYKRLCGLDVCKADLDRTRKYVQNLASSGIEIERIFWRGDRIEWILARGHHEWFMKEIAEGRVLWAGLGVP